MEDFLFKINTFFPLQILRSLKKWRNKGMMSMGGEIERELVDHRLWRIPEEMKATKNTLKKKKETLSKMGIREDCKKRGEWYRTPHSAGVDTGTNETKDQITGGILGRLTLYNTLHLGQRCSCWGILEKRGQWWFNRTEVEGCIRTETAFPKSPEYISLQAFHHMCSFIKWSHICSP